jgi:hypothetical protein
LPDTSAPALRLSSEFQRESAKTSLPEEHMNSYVLLADVVTVFHGAYIAFVAGGFALIIAGAVRRWQWTRVFWFRVAHFGAIAFVCVEEIAGRVCPLTSLESRLREAGAETKYSRDFVGYWVDRLIFYDFPSRVFLYAYIAFGLLVTAAFVLAPPQLPRRRRRTYQGVEETGESRP